MVLLRSMRPFVLIAAGALLLHCGARSEIAELTATGGAASSASSTIGTSTATTGSGAGGAGGSANDAGPLVDASCTPAPPAGVTIATLSTNVLSIALAATGGTVFAGIAATTPASALLAGTIDGVPSNGGSVRPLASPSFNFGNVATDGARLYYAQSVGHALWSGSASYTVTGLAAVDLASGAVLPIATDAPPWSVSSNLNSSMIAATPAWPGVFWIGGMSGSDGAGKLSAWTPASTAATVLATGDDLSGLAVDATSVYWADVGAGQGITVFNAPLGGGAKATLANVPGGTHGVLLGVSTTDVVFVSDYASGAIHAVSKTGGPVRPLVTAAASWVNAFAWVDEVYLYWTESGSASTLKRIPVAGGAAEVVPTSGQIQSLAFDACNRYVGTLGPTQIFAHPR
jgi:hypothetical protein